MDGRDEPGHDDAVSDVAKAKKTTRYTTGEIGRVRVIADFLPPPVTRRGKAGSGNVFAAKYLSFKV